MYCRDCYCAKQGYFKSKPDAYVCTGVKEPFVISDYQNAECSEYKDKKNNSSTNDGAYMELFVIKNGFRHNVKIIEMKEVENILTNSFVDGIENLWK